MTAAVTATANAADTAAVAVVAPGRLVDLDTRLLQLHDALLS